jgi:hypothetical protein
MKASLTIRPVAEGLRFLGRDESAAERELLPARAAACEQCGVGSQESNREDRKQFIHGTDQDRTFC